jgi:hypothetical protein
VINNIKVDQSNADQIQIGGCVRLRFRNSAYTSGFTTRVDTENCNVKVGVEESIVKATLV